MKKNEVIDEGIRKLVDEGLQDALPDDEARAAAVAAIMQKLAPSYCAAAQRRRNAADLRSAFKDGFTVGSRFGRFARWHSEIWSRSETARSLKQPENDRQAVSQRYAAYNDW